MRKQSVGNYGTFREDAMALIQLPDVAEVGDEAAAPACFLAVLSSP